MDTKEWAQLQESLLAEQLKIVRRFLGKEEGPKRTQLSKEKSRSKIGIVEDILKNASKPLHVTEIIKIAKKEYQVLIERESIVSAITKKINKGETFIRTAGNTFSLKLLNSEKNGENHRKNEKQ